MRTFVCKNIEERYNFIAAVGAAGVGYLTFDAAVNQNIFGLYSETIQPKIFISLLYG
ncbi:MAG: hypothetical protein LBS81_00735 [Endomicrobium sp.]|nr:hypothetical protein [Endomicrobium sp.]